MIPQACDVPGVIPAACWQAAFGVFIVPWLVFFLAWLALGWAAKELRRQWWTPEECEKFR